MAARRRRRGGHQQGAVQVRGPHRRRTSRSRGAGCAAAQADRRGGGAGAGPQGPHADHRERHRAGAGRRRASTAPTSTPPNSPCCQSIPTAARRRCALGCATGSASTVGVVVTDTMGRAWRNGQTDAAIGAAGLAVLHGYAGRARSTRQRAARHRGRRRRRDRRRRRSGEGQADRDPGRGGAGTDTARRRIQRAARWCGPARRTCSGSAPRRRIALGRAQAQLLRRSVRSFSDEPVAPDLDRDRRGRGTDGARAAPHPAGAVRVDARPRRPGSRCWTG